ncbi:MAG: hypothetical protein HYV09_36980 [Deltaproteobacteria bacterium]|nr:hypothetical protein [Deltaproteobacteria bacterium]
MITREQARAQVASGLPGEWVLDDEATIERPWGWVFFYVARSGEPLFGNAPVFVDREGRVLEESGTAMPVEYYIDRLERGSLLQRLRRALSPLPRSPTLRFPTSFKEAQRVFRRWDRLNGRYFVIADVRTAARVLPRVTFDAHTNIAVTFEDTPLAHHPQLWSVPIVEVLRVERWRLTTDD